MRGSCTLLVSLGVACAIVAALAPADPTPRLAPPPAPACWRHADCQSCPGALDRSNPIENPIASGSDIGFYVIENPGIVNPWAGGAYQSVDLTYSFLPDGVNMPSLNSSDSSGQNVIHARLNALFGDEATWKALFRDAFDQWEAATGNTYTQVPDDGASWPSSGGVDTPGQTRGDIRIGMRSIDGVGGFLGFNNFPGAGGDMVLDADENWGNVNFNFRFLRNVIMHEHGHGLGLAHVCPVEFNKLMEPIFAFDFDGPQLDDIRGVHRMYGDPLEPNNSIGSPSAPGEYGLVPNLQIAYEGASLHRWFDVDHYAVNVSTQSTLSVSVTPFGWIYPSEATINGFTCVTPFPSTNAIAAQNLVLQILDSVGNQIALASSTAAGNPESITNLSLPPGNYVIRVSSSFTSSTPGEDVQIYTLEALLSNGGIAADLNGDGCVSPADLALLLGEWGTADPIADLDASGVVGPSDLALLLGAWTGC
jgi:hypothetical protein